MSKLPNNATMNDTGYNAILNETEYSSLDHAGSFETDIDKLLSDHSCSLNKYEEQSRKFDELFALITLEKNNLLEFHKSIHQLPNPTDNSYTNVDFMNTSERLFGYLDNVKQLDNTLDIELRNLDTCIETIYPMVKKEGNKMKYFKQSIKEKESIIQTSENRLNDVNHMIVWKQYQIVFFMIQIIIVSAIIYYLYRKHIKGKPLPTRLEIENIKLKNRLGNLNKQIRVQQLKNTQLLKPILNLIETAQNRAAYMFGYKAPPQRLFQPSIPAPVPVPVPASAPIVKPSQVVRPIS